MAELPPEEAHVETEMAEDRTGAEGTAEEAPPEAVEVVPLMSKGLRNFIIGMVLGLVVNCFMAFGFFLMVEDNPRSLLSLNPLDYLMPGLVVGGLLILLALVVRRGWWTSLVGYGLAMLVVVGLTVNWARNSHPIPTEAQMCAALRDLYAVFDESMVITANTPAEQAMAWRSKMVEVYKQNYKTLQFVPRTDHSAIDLLQKEFQALEGQDKTGRIANDIHAKGADNKNLLRKKMAQVCQGE